MKELNIRRFVETCLSALYYNFKTCHARLAVKIACDWVFNALVPPPEKASCSKRWFAGCGAVGQNDSGMLSPAINILEVACSWAERLEAETLALR